MEDFDPIADAGSSAVDVRVFKDVRLRRMASSISSFVRIGKSSIRECAGTDSGHPGKIKTDPDSARHSDFVEANGTRWSGDHDFHRRPNVE